MSVVSVVKCDSYEHEKVESAIKESLRLLGGLEKIIKKNDKVLLKVNALLGKTPETATTTHPEIVRAMIREVKKSGGMPIVGDCSGDAMTGTMHAMKISRIREVCDEEGVPCLCLETTGFKKVKIPNGKQLHEVHVAKPVLKADVVITMPKLKTHVETLYTGAVKNMFGAVPHGDRKKAHRLKDYKKFSEALVDIYSVAKPHLAVMDAIYGMEGFGPSQGNPKKIGFVLASFDSVALDTVACKIVGFRENEVHTTVAAGERELGTDNLKKIRIVGDKPEKIKFKKPNTILTGPSFFGFMLGLRSMQPSIIKKKCVACGTCAKSCPVGAISINTYARIDRDKCIQCYCCHELCPEGAVGIEGNLISRVIGSFQNLKERIWPQ